MVCFCISIRSASDLSISGIDGVSPSLESESLSSRNAGAQGQEKMEVSAQLERRLILLLLRLLQALNRLVMPIHTGESGLLYFSNQFKC